MSDALINDWEGEARKSQVNFIAIEVGDAAESDPDLAVLLSTNVPPGASVYIVLCDDRVPDEEIEQLRTVLDQQEIPLAWAAPLNPDDASDWGLPSVLRSEAPVAEAFEHPASSAGAHDFHPHDVADRCNAQYLHEIALDMESQNRMLTFRTSENSTLIAATQELREATGAKLSLRPAIINAFNELQVTTSWQHEKDNPGAQVLRDLLIDIRLEKNIQEDAEGLLSDLFHALRDDADVLPAVLNAAAQLPRDLESMVTVSMIYIACMEQRVALGKLDDGPGMVVALDFAHRVQRYHLMEQIAEGVLEATQNAEAYHSRLNDALCSAFDKALMDILLNGGTREQPPRAGEGLAAETVQNAWREMQQRGNAHFPQFLDQWEPWQGLVRRRQERLKEERQAQE